jgi:hypothetical protein
MVMVMNGPLKLLFLSLAVLTAAVAVDYLIMPSTAPVAWGNDPRPLWQVEVAFILRALENVSAMIVGIIVVLAAVFYVRRWLRPKSTRRVSEHQSWR